MTVELFQLQNEMIYKFLGHDFTPCPLFAPVSPIESDYNEEEDYYDSFQPSDDDETFYTKQYKDLCQRKSIMKQDNVQLLQKKG